MLNLLTWPIRQWVSRLWVDPIIIAAVVGVHWWLVSEDRLPGLLDGTPVASRPALYGAAAIVLSLTGTLGSISVAQYLQAKGDRVKALKERHPTVLGLSWKIIFVNTLLGSVLFLCAYAADLGVTSPTPGVPVDTGSSSGAWIFEVGALVSLVSVFRLVYLFSQLVDLIVLDETEPVTQAVAINSEFFTDSPSPDGHPPPGKDASPLGKIAQRVPPRRRSA